MATKPIPEPGNEILLEALKAMWRKRTILASLEVFNQHVGNIFWINLPFFKTAFMIGPEANRFVLVEGRDQLKWRTETDPVTHLLREGVLVLDDEAHDEVRHAMMPPLHQKHVQSYCNTIIRYTDQVTQEWSADQPRLMLDEMRKIALLVLTDTLFGVDMSPDLRSMWDVVLKTIDYISPGVWIIFPQVPRFGYKRALKRMDDYLHKMIVFRRAEGTSGATDLLGVLIEQGMEDGKIRDQLLTMLIAGHDTSTALLSWTLYNLTLHPEVLAKTKAEVDACLGNKMPDADSLGQLGYLECVIDETLRLYPPIHLGSRRAATDIEYQDYIIPTGTRVMYSIYLTHRHPDYWQNPEHFDPDRFLPENKRAIPHYTYLPFGGGKRNCIGMAFAKVESKIVLARILQQFDLEFVGKRVRPYMKATLEPHPGVLLKVKPRN